MGGGDKKEVKSEVNQEQTRVQNQYDNLYNQMEEKRDNFSNQSQQERDYLKNSLQGINESGTGGLNQSTIDNIRGLYAGKTVGFDNNTSGGSSGGGGGGGGSIESTVAGPQTGVFDEPEKLWRNFAETGGVEMDKLRAQIPELEKMAQTGAFDPETKTQVLDIVNKLKNFQYDPQAKESIQNTINQLKGIAQTGGYNPEALARIRGDIENLRTQSTTGGVDPAQLAKLRESYGFMLEGGMSPEDIAKFRGTGFDEFANTGGWTPEQAAEYRNRATSVIPALYAQQQNDAQRMAAISGGSPEARAAAAAQMARRGAQDLNTASRDAEIDLQGQIREGRRWGIEGLRDTEIALQKQLGDNRGTGLSAGNQLELGVGTNRINATEAAMRGETTLEQNMAANKLGAAEAAGGLEVDFQNSINDAIQKSLTGAGNLMTNMETAISQNRIRAQEIAASAEAKAQQLRQEGMLAGAQGLTQIAAQKAAEARAASSQAASARAADQANERWWAQFISANEQYIGDHQMQGEQNALRNLTQIYGMDPSLARDSFQADIARDQAGANSRLLGIDASMAADSRDWTDWAKFGLGMGGSAMQVYDRYNNDGNYVPSIPGGQQPNYGNPPSVDELPGESRDRHD